MKRDRAKMLQNCYTAVTKNKSIESLCLLYHVCMSMLLYLSD